MVFYICLCRRMSVGYKDAVFTAQGSRVCSQCVYQNRQTCTGFQDATFVAVRSYHCDSCNTDYLADSGLPTCILATILLVLQSAYYICSHQRYQSSTVAYAFFPVVGHFGGCTFSQHWLLCYQTQPSPIRPVYDSVILLLRLPADAD